MWYGRKRQKNLIEEESKRDMGVIRCGDVFDDIKRELAVTDDSLIVMNDDTTTIGIWEDEVSDK